MLRENLDQLKLVLLSLIDKYQNNNKIEKHIVNAFLKRNLEGKYGKYIYTKKWDIQTMSDDEDTLFKLFVFTKAFSEAIKEFGDGDSEKLLIEKYFTKIEVETWSNFKLEKKEISGYPYVFSNMIKLGEGHFIGAVTSKQLYGMDVADDILYNFNTQRNPKFNSVGLKQINVDKSKVIQIKSNLLKGNQFPDAIKLNVLGEVDFNEKTGELKILSGVINIFDGYHRKTANSLAMLENQDLEFTWELVITNFTEAKARAFMAQIDKQKPISFEHAKSLDENDLGNIVVKTIKNQMSEFSDKIKDSENELKFGGLTKKSIIVEAAKDNYKKLLTNKIEAEEIGEHINKVVNYIFGLYQDEFLNNPNKYKEISFINNKNMFYGYIYLSSLCYKKEDWKPKIKETLIKSDFTLDNTLWKDYKIDKSEDINKSSKNKIYNYFEAIAKDVI
jgi:hypothetical protein